MRQRVALVIGQLTRGGAEGQLAQLAVRLDRSRFEPIVYCLSDAVKPYAAQIEAAGVRVVIVAGSTVGRLRRLAKHFLDDDIDIVHSWLFLANAAAGFVQLFSPRRALITSARNRKVQGRINRIANMIAFRLSRNIVVNSQDVAAYLRRNYRAPAEKIRLIVNGIDTQRFRPRSRVDAGPPYVLGIGRLVEQKNFALFLEAAAGLRRRLPDVHFGIAGAGPLRASLEAQAHRLELQDALEFLGERSDIDVLLPAASLFWLTSNWEGMPNVVLESMACGVPVVVTDVGGARELIEDGKSGFVLQSGDRDGFVNLSQRLLSDPESWQLASTAARQRAETFSLSHMVQAMQQLYEEVLQ